MPIGCQIAITPVINEYTTLKPKSVLDVGIGSGTFGLLFREYSDIMYERYDKEDWQIRIDGVEIWDKYITDSHKHWYNNIYIKNILEFEPEIHYDLVYMGDIIEHLDKETGFKLLERIKKYTDNIIITTPAWWCNPEHDPLGNPNEHHLSFWNLEDFKDWKVILKDPICVMWSRNVSN